MKKIKVQDNFEVLRKIQKDPDASQRKMAEELGFSLRKLNYCLKSLKSKGLVKINNFSKQKNKINYIQYIITPKQIITYPTTSPHFAYLNYNFNSTQVTQPYSDLTTINIKL